jgi:hypothetical protein
MPGQFGTTDSEDGVVASTSSSNQSGVFGSNTSKSPSPPGSPGGAGVFGLSVSPGAAGVFGANNSDKGMGVQGNGPEVGIGGFSEKGIGVRGDTKEGFAAVHGNGGKNGVWGYTLSATDSGVYGSNDGSGYGVAGFSKNGIGVLGRGGRLAGLFEGDIEVTGDIRLKNADCAEDFDIAGLQLVEPGSVMVIDSEGALRPSDRAYDKRVAGVISGAGSYKPGLILDKQESSKNRMPIALMGKVYCKVDASYGAIEVGDLLTTSPTLGHAMKADDPMKVFGSVIGKALRPLKEGQELIPILIALQ